MLESLGWIVFVVIMLYGVTFISEWQKLLLIKFVNYNKPYFELWRGFKLPDYLQDIFNEIKPKIVALDFRLVAVLKPIQQNNDLPPQPYFLLQKNSDESTFLELIAPTTPLVPNDFNFALTSICTDGSRVCSFANMDLTLFTKLEHEYCQTLYNYQLEEVYQAHQAFLTQLGKTISVERLTAEQACFYSNDFAKNRQIQQLEQGSLQADGEFYRFTFSHALKLAFKRIKLKSTIVNNIHLQPVPPVRQQYFLQQYLANMDSSLTASDKLKFFILTFILSMLFGLILLDLNMLIIITLVVLLHELGHFLAMRCLGYQNTNIYLIPLLGGIATGRQQQINENHETWVLLAGPLPGFILGVGAIVGLAVSGYAEWAKDMMNRDFLKFLLTLIAINGLNLLPIQPLDGGKLFSILLKDKTSSIGKWISLPFSLIGIAISIFIVGSPIMAIIFALPLLLLFGKAKDKSKQITVNKNDTPASILAKLCEQDNNMLPFSENLEKSYNLWLSSQQKTASWLNRLAIAIILLVTPIALLASFLFMWQYI